VELTEGIVVRVREEDFKNGQQVRTTTWRPATVKAVSRIPESLPWTNKNDVRELTVMGDGSEEESDPTYQWTVVEKGLTVTTKAGTFTHVIKVQRDKLNDKGEVKLDKVRYYWLAPGVGKIREESEERTEELVSFDVKK
jgi:cell wall assembly regulator SMI1